MAATLALTQPSRREDHDVAPEVTDSIYREMEARVRAVLAAGPGAIDQRLRALDEEWDIERKLRANAATLSLVGVGVGAMFRRRLFFLPGIVAAFLLQTAIQSLSPSRTTLRRRGLRTTREIEQERHVLKMLRGDFARPGANDPEDTEYMDDVDRAMSAVRR